MSKPLKDLTDLECFALYQEMMRNSDKRWDSALLLAKHEDYGGAIRDHITSMEEMIKACIMFMDSKGFEFRSVPEIESIMRRSHTLRHFIGFVMFVMNIFLDDLKSMILKIRENPSLIKNFKENKDKLEMHGKYYIFRKIIHIRKEAYWFSKVEKYRQEGTHVDYNPAIKSPLEISSEDYHEVHKRLNNVRVTGKGVIETFDATDDEVTTHLEDLKQKFKTECWYPKVGEAIISTKSGKKNPFDVAKKFFFDDEVS